MKMKMNLRDWQGLAGGREGWVALLARETNLRDLLGCEPSFEKTVEEVSGLSRRAVKTSSAEKIGKWQRDQ